MLAYILRRLLLIIPTLFGILIINFIIIQAAPGGPVEQMIAKIEGFDGATSRIAGGGAEVSVAGSNYRGAQGLDPALVKEIERMYGFDKSAPERLWIMIKNYTTLDFGDSFFRDAKVIDLIVEKMPVSISLGLWSTLISIWCRSRWVSPRQPATAATSTSGPARQSSSATRYRPSCSPFC